jgi:phage shock protein A
MALLERVATLIRANLNELLDHAENPETMIKQVILDMQNQLLQVKTQVAIAIADQHVLEKKQKENEEKAADWAHRAEMAVDKKQDDLARASLERSVAYGELAESFRQQVADQKLQVEDLKAALIKLEQKLSEAEARRDVLLAQHRRARAARKADDTGSAAGSDATLDRMREKVLREEAIHQAASELAHDDVERKLADLEKQDQIERMLNELKARRNR